MPSMSSSQSMVSSLTSRPARRRWAMPMISLSMMSCTGEMVFAVSSWPMPPRTEALDIAIAWMRLVRSMKFCASRQRLSVPVP